MVTYNIECFLLSRAELLQEKHTFLFSKLLVKKVKQVISG